MYDINVHFDLYFMYKYYTYQSASSSTPKHTKRKTINVKLMRLKIALLIQIDLKLIFPFIYMSMQQYLHVLEHTPVVFGSMLNTSYITGGIHRWYPCLQVSETPRSVSQWATLLQRGTIDSATEKGRHFGRPRKRRKRLCAIILGFQRDNLWYRH